MRFRRHWSETFDAEAEVRLELAKLGVHFDPSMPDAGPYDRDWVAGSLAELERELIPIALLLAEILPWKA